MKTSRRGWRFYLGLTLLAMSVLLLAVPDLNARLGGGESFGGGGHSSGGGGSWGGGSSGGGGGGEVLFALLHVFLRLILNYPFIGVPTLALIIGGIIALRWRRNRIRDALYQQRDTDLPSYLGLSTRNSVGAQIRQLQVDDANFSRPVFLDFVQLLYARSHSLRPGGDASAVAAYIRPAAWEAFAGQTRPKEVSEVVIGSVRIVRLSFKEPIYHHIYVEFEASLREGSKRWYRRERWSLRRKRGVLSQGPEAVQALRCPSCGSAEQVGTDGRCPSCHNVVDRGDFAWVVHEVRILAQREPEPITLSLGGVEAGTHRPTVFQPDLDSARRQFSIRHPEFHWPAFEQLVRDLFMRLQKAWTERDWKQIRPYETDSLFQTHRYWMERYQSQSLRNVLEDIVVERVLPVKIELDAYYESVVVRIWAAMKDSTVDESGRIVGGDAHVVRHFTEYWTFIRRAGRTAETKSLDQCPSCGASLTINQAGICDFCQSKVVSGDFGWVLSTIEQDEVYRG